MGNDNTNLRRYEDDLHVSGLAVVILGAWSVLKLIMEVILEGQSVFKMDEFGDDEKLIAMLVYGVIIFIVVAISLLIFAFHFFIGMNASKAARGLPYKKGYYVCAIIMLVLSVLGIAAYYEEFKNLEEIDTTIASLLVDLTTIYVFFVVVISTNKIRKLKNNAK